MSKQPLTMQEIEEQKWKDSQKPVECNTLNDIKMILQPFLEDIVGDEIRVSAKVGDDNVTSVSRSSSRRKLLLEGLGTVRKRIDALAKMREKVDEGESEGIKSRLAIWDINNIRFNIDSIIERKMGGKRHGTRIRWSVQDGTFEYDPFLNKLYRIEE